MRRDTHITRDLADHVPGHSLIVKLLSEWDAGRSAPVRCLQASGWPWGSSVARSSSGSGSCLASCFPS